MENALILGSMFPVLYLLIVAAPALRGWQNDAVADARRKCVEAMKGPAPAPFVQLPVEKFDACIVAEANKWSLTTRQAICALGRSGGASGSTVEVYMANGRCRTDYE